MRNLLVPALVLTLTVPVHADAIQKMRLAINEARLQMTAQNWDAAARVLRSLEKQMFLEAALDPYRTKVQFVLWDLRMGNHDAALKDLDALAALIAP